MGETLEEASKRVLKVALTERMKDVKPADIIDELSSDSKIKHIMQRHIEMAEYISAEIMKSKPDVIGIKKAATALISESVAIKSLGSAIVTI